MSYFMSDIDHNVFLRIGKCLVNDNDYYNMLTMKCDNIFPTKTYDQYREDYLQKLHVQLNGLIKLKGKLEEEYLLALEDHTQNIKKITYINNKIGKKLIVSNTLSNTTTTFLSLRMKRFKNMSQETINNDIELCKKMNKIEKEIYLINVSIKKIKQYISEA